MTPEDILEVREDLYDEDGDRAVEQIQAARKTRGRDARQAWDCKEVPLIAIGQDARR